MKKLLITAVGLIVASVILPASIFAKHPGWQHCRRPAGMFKHVGTFDVMAGNNSSVAEIVDVTTNGKQLIYTDGDNGAIGFVNIRNPAKPFGQGVVNVGGEPTSLVILDPLVIVGVNTSVDYNNPSGQLVVVNRISRQIVAVHELGGQPDSIALAPDKKRAAVVIENERDEDLDLGFGEGVIPQNDTGKLLIVNLQGAAENWTIVEADLSPVAETAYAGEDLEPEFVDINKENEAVVTFQENNHLAVIDMITGQTISNFSAGEVVLNNVDTEGDDLITFKNTIVKRAEPDAVAWIDNDTFATANEGDYEDEFGVKGGSRGFTIFNQDGTVEFNSNESFEHWLASAGHYNEGRSKKKGCEPEAVEVGIFGKGRMKKTLLFVGSERCNAVGVYKIGHNGIKPLQILPTGIGPEGLKAIPSRNLFVASTEKDEAEDGIPTMINIYRASRGSANYPMIISENDTSGTPIPWVALSGLAADPLNADTIYAVSDSFLAQGFIYTIDVSSHPARIIDRLQVTGADESLDLEGIAVGPDGNFWLGSEGKPGTRSNLVLKVDASDGTVINQIKLPAGLEANARKNGIEGISVTGRPGNEVIFVAIQRAWLDGIDTDKVNTKIGRYDVATGQWGFVHYPLQPEGNGGWIGLSEITHLFKGHFALIERDKGWGPTTGLNAELKAIYHVNLKNADFRAFNDPAGLVTVKKTLIRNVLPALKAASIWTAEKLEGLAVTNDGKVFIVTDNDGLDDATGETVFLNISKPVNRIK